ncbi:MAG: hypothetical protein K2X27_18055 [Candidatus Obscuribacterales bacterium]|nr:hypothetical protein [Candidatus Obscuribacterales bacterium]
MNLHIGGEKKNKFKLLFGPGTVLMLVVLCSIVGKQLMVPQHVTIERKVIASGKKLERRNPTVTDVLGWSLELKLRPKQVQELRSIEQTELTSLRPIEHDIEDARREFDKLVAERHGQVAMSEIQRLCEPATRLSFIKRTILEAASDRALDVLEPAQRSAVIEMAQSRLSLARRAAARNK